jgi:hypothetical protein
MLKRRNEAPKNAFEEKRQAEFELREVNNSINLFFLQFADEFFFL